MIRTHHTQRKSLGLALVGALLATASYAAGPLYTTDNPQNVQALRWDTSKGAIPVYTDLGVFTYSATGTVFLSNAQADGLTSFALTQWSQVPTSTWRAQTSGFTKFDQVPSIGGNVAGHGQLLTNDQGTVNPPPGIRTLQPGEVGPETVYGVFNGGGLYVNYDTDGSILETYFGVPKTQVLGIAFPEWAEDKDGDGFAETITEATAVLNGWFVHVTDTEGARVAGVFTHEFGHAINLSHSQVNGPMAYASTTYLPKFPGVKGCVDPIYRWDSASTISPRLEPRYIETMAPFINTTTVVDNRSAGTEQSTIDLPDDKAAISNLYPTSAYLSTTGTISGVLRLKDGVTPYSGVNIVARNAANPLGDAISAMSGDQTQGKIGPDGRFQIRGLTAGQSYLLYIEPIAGGGYPTTPMPLVSQSEYWDVNESSNPAADLPCSQTPIVVQAGVATQADMQFNGYTSGISYRPLVSAQLTDLARFGNRAAGFSGTVPFIWDASKGIVSLPSNVAAPANPAIDAGGRKMTALFDYNGNGIQSASTWRSRDGRLSDLGSLNGDTCGGGSASGVASTMPWAMDDSGNTVVGLGYVEKTGDSFCNTQFKGEILPTIWTPLGGMRTLSTEGLDLTRLAYVRAHAISGNASVILGAAPANQRVVAWVDGGAPLNLDGAVDSTGTLINAVDAYALTKDGSRVALSTRTRGMMFWQPRLGVTPQAFTETPGPEFCTDPDFPYFNRLGADLCKDPNETPATIKAKYGVVPVMPADMSDDGKVIIARAGSSANGYVGMFRVEGLGWFKFRDFFRRQGVVEAYDFGMENPLSLNAEGNQLVGGMLGVSASYFVDMKNVFVCQNGKSVKTKFPDGFITAVQGGALPARCEHL